MLRSIPASVRVACCALLLLFTPALYSCTDSNQHQASKPPPAAREHSDGPHLDLPTQEPVIRVRLQREDGRGGGVEVGTQKHDINLKSSGTTVTVPGPVNIKRTRNGWTVTDGSAKAHSFPTDDQLVLDANTPLLLNHKGGARRYGGSLHCVPSSDENQVSWDLIEHVSVEAYLPGVLVGELYKGWTEACYSAQCVAARSFACMQIQHRTHHSYDVTDGPSSQAYHGVVDRSDADAWYCLLRELGWFYTAASRTTTRHNVQLAVQRLPMEHIQTRRFDVLAEMARLRVMHEATRMRTHGSPASVQDDQRRVQQARHQATAAMRAWTKTQGHRARL